MTVDYNDNNWNPDEQDATRNEELKGEKEHSKQNEYGQLPDDEITTDDDYDYSDFQVVRPEFFAHIREPSFTFNRGKVGVNKACVSRLPDVDYVQLMINRKKKLLAVRPCEEYEMYSFRWCRTAKNGKREARSVTAPIFHAMVCDLMKWNLDNRYKILGRLIRANERPVFIFALPSRETYLREETEEGKFVTSRKPQYPDEWKNQFGIPYEEHQKALQINIFDGFAIYGINGDCVELVQPKDDSRPSEQSGTDLYPGGDIDE